MLAFSAARAAEKLFRSGREQGMLLYGISGYRSFERQEKLYRERLKKASREYVESHLAPPGASEHQTGLALDVSCPGAGLELTEKFADTKKGAGWSPMPHCLDLLFAIPEEKKKSPDMRGNPGISAM